MKKLLRISVLLLVSMSFMGFRPEYIFNQESFLNNWSVEDQLYYLEDPLWYSFWIYFNGDREDEIA